jgi:phosphatidylserine/phosphatidylglycerophosphate/cardiolipin synthase-like enzyme
MIFLIVPWLFEPSTAPAPSFFPSNHLLKPLLELSESDLRGLAGALRSGRLLPPFPTVALQRFLAHNLVSGIADSINQVAAAGCSAEALAMWLDVLAESARERGSIEDAVHLVTTGPEGVDADHRDTAVVVQDLFRRVRQSVLVSGYALYQGRPIFQELAERMDLNPSLGVRMFLDIGHEKPDAIVEPADAIARFVQTFKDRHWPAGSRLPEIYYDTRSLEGQAVLHSKCIVVDGEELFVSSANFTDAAQHRNIEMGLLVTSRSIAAQALRFFDSLVRSGDCRRAV